MQCALGLALHWALLCTQPRFALSLAKNTYRVLRLKAFLVLFLSYLRHLKVSKNLIKSQEASKKLLNSPRFCFSDKSNLYKMT